MSLPAPNLDDRSFSKIVEEAKKMITKYCPQWTDFNESDPGITLIELMAWMTEMMIYRINRVPDKNYIKFLELMGVSLRPQQPSSAWIVFTVSNKGPTHFIPEGSILFTSEEIAEPVQFEITDGFKITNSRIVEIYSTYNKNSEEEKYKKLYPFKEEEENEQLPISFVGSGVNVFPLPDEKAGINASHIFYLGLTNPANLHKGMCLNLSVTVKKEIQSPIEIKWECWSREGWTEIKPLQDTSGFTKNGEVVFDFIPLMKETEINGKSAFWIRACYISGNDIPKLSSVQKNIIGKDISPRSIFIRKNLFVKNSLKERPIQYYDKDIPEKFFPFGDEKEQDGILYIGSHVFSRRDSVISIEIGFVGRNKEDLESNKENVVIRWEYYSESGSWKSLGESSMNTEKEKNAGQYCFVDETDAFTKVGCIKYNCPDDFGKIVIGDVESYWIKAEIVKGKYVAYPEIRDLSLKFKEKRKDFDYYVSENYSNFQDLTQTIYGKNIIKPFVINVERDPSLYLAFNKPISDDNLPHSIYFRFNKEKKTTSSHIIWEYFCNKGWKELELKFDGTHSFSQDGAIMFSSPTDWIKSDNFGNEQYWLRARLMTGYYSKSPRLIGVHLNATKVKQVESIKDEVLGTSTGEPDQVFTFTNIPMLPDPEILVRESENTSLEEKKRYKLLPKEDIVEEKGSGLWIRWHEVDSFLKSKSSDRHYIFDVHMGVVTFGDGKRGMVPPMGIDNIKSSVYRVTTGVRGNVGINTITQLEQTNSSIEAITNPDSASGGADAETLEEAKLRGPCMLKHRHRAVTVEDFEKLAIESSGEVAKSKCFVADGKIRVVVIPKGDTEILQPGVMLIHKVKEYLDERRLITTSLTVEGPVYIGFLIEAEVVVDSWKTDVTPEIREKIRKKLREYFHPLKGGPAGDGWPLGRAIFISEIYYILENVEGVDHVEKAWLNDGNGLRHNMKITIGKMNLPYLMDVNYL